MPNPEPDIDDTIRAAWNEFAPYSQWITELGGDHALVVDDTDRSLYRVPVLVGETVEFGVPEPVDPNAASTEDRTVFASRAESRPDADDDDSFDVAAGVDGDEVVAHLRGRHDQAKHGNRFKTPGDRMSGLRREGRSRTTDSSPASGGQGSTRGGRVAEPAQQQARESPADAVRSARLRIPEGVSRDHRYMLAEQRFLQASDRNRVSAEKAWRRERDEAFAHDIERQVADYVNRLPTDLLDLAIWNPRVRKAVDDYADALRDHYGRPDVSDRADEERKRAALDAARENVTASQFGDSRGGPRKPPGKDRDAYLRNLPVADEASMHSLAELRTKPADRLTSDDTQRAADGVRQAEVDVRVAEMRQRAVHHRQDWMRGLHDRAEKDSATPDQLRAIKDETKRLLDESDNARDALKAARSRRDQAVADRDAAVKRHDDGAREQAATVAKQLQNAAGPQPDMDAIGRDASKAIRKELGLPSATRARQLARSRDRDQSQTGSIAESLARHAARVAQTRAGLDHGDRQRKVLEARLAALRDGELQPGAEWVLRDLLRRAYSNVETAKSYLASEERELADTRDRWRRLQQGEDLYASADEDVAASVGDLFDYPTDVLGDFLDDAENPDSSLVDIDVAAGIDGDEVAAHLRGRHDQAKHGNRFNKPGDRSSGLRRSGQSRQSTSENDGGNRPSGTDRSPSTDSGRPAVADSSQEQRRQAVRQSRLSTPAGRREVAQQYDRMNRQEFSELSEERQQEILEDLRRIAEVRDTTTLRRGSGNIRGVEAPHVAMAKAKLRELTTAPMQPIDNSLEARAERARNATTFGQASQALTGATKTELLEIGYANGWMEGASAGWKIGRLREHIAERASGKDWAGRPIAASISDAPWNDLSPDDYTSVQWRGACLIDTGQGAENDNFRYYLPVREPGGALNRNAVSAAVSELEHGDVPTDHKIVASRVLARIFRTELNAELPEAVARLCDLPTVNGSQSPIDSYAEPTAAPSSPAAEPEPNTEPTEEEGPVSTLSTDVRSRLGLPEDADDAAVLAALDDVRTKADNPQPSPEQIAASVAAQAEADELRKEVQVLASTVQDMSAKLAAAEAEKTATVKASVLDEAVKQGKIRPAEREQWAKDYDEAPNAITRVLASIAPGTAVPVVASGETTNPDAVDVDAEWRQFEHLFPAETVKEG